MSLRTEASLMNDLEDWLFEQDPFEVSKLLDAKLRDMLNRSYDIVRIAQEMSLDDVESENYGVTLRAVAYDLVDHELGQRALDMNYTDIDDLWDAFYDVPTVEIPTGQTVIEARWYHFPVGTDIEVVWKWFDEKHPKGIVYLLSGLDPADE